MLLPSPGRCRHHAYAVSRAMAAHGSAAVSRDCCVARPRAQVRLWQLGRLLPSRLCDHLEGHAALPVLYASSWLLTCFAADFPLSFAARVMDLVLTDCYAAPMMKVLHGGRGGTATGTWSCVGAAVLEVQRRAPCAPACCLSWERGGAAPAPVPARAAAAVQVAVGILRRCEPALLEMGDMEDMVDHIRTAVPAWPKPVLQARGPAGGTLHGAEPGAAACGR